MVRVFRCLVCRCSAAGAQDGGKGRRRRASKGGQHKAPGLACGSIALEDRLLEEAIGCAAANLSTSVLPSSLHRQSNARCQPAWALGLAWAGWLLGSCLPALGWWQ